MMVKPLITIYWDPENPLAGMTVIAHAIPDQPGFTCHSTSTDAAITFLRTVCLACAISAERGLLVEGKAPGHVEHILDNDPA